MGKMNFSGSDFSGEPTRFSLSMVDLTAANIDAQLALVVALEAALDDITYIPFAHEVLAVSNLPGGQATDANGQRESKVRVRYRNTTTLKKFAVEIGAPIKTGQLLAGSDFINLASTEWAAFKSAFEAVVKPSDNLANAVEIINAQVVGRAL